LEDLVNDFYKELFSAELELSVQEILDHVSVRVTAPMNDAMDAPYTTLEVDRALAMMGANKAPRPDGFMAGFF
jgi:hypothetical protein